MRLFLLSTFMLLTGIYACYAVEPEAKKFSVSIETGMLSSVNNTIDPRWQIRKSAWSYYDYGYNSNYGAPYDDQQICYFTVKPEYLFAGDKLIVSAGLRLSNVYSSIASGIPADNQSFYLLYNQTANVTEYAKVKEISQNNYYLSVPVELSFIPWRWNTLCLYGKAGFDFGFLLNSISDISFLNSSMDVYRQSILNKVGVDPNPLYSSLYTAIGVKFGKPNKLRYNFELNLPSALITGNNSSILTIGSLTGFSFSVSIPIK